MAGFCHGVARGVAQCFVILLLLCFVTRSVAYERYDQHQHPLGVQGHVEQSTSSDNPPASSTIPSAAASTETMPVSTAQQMVTEALEEIAILNKGRLHHPQPNMYRLRDDSDKGSHPAPPLDGTGAAAMRQEGAVSANSPTYAYTIPRLLAHAARILAEVSPPGPTDDSFTAAIQKLAEYRHKVSDTNVPEQTLRRPNGLEGHVPADTHNETVPAMLEEHNIGDFWLANMMQLGESPFAPTGYKVWRNVLDYGAKGDGITDDTAAINQAISDGGRCGASCGSGTIHPAFIYFPPGTYLVSSPIIHYPNTELYGNPLDFPTILAASSFVGLGVVTSDIHTGSSSEWYLDTDNSLRSIRNFQMDITRTDPAAYVCGIHWQVAHATSLENIIFKMTIGGVTTQQGILIENGNGGLLTNLTFVGGNVGAYFGTQQFTTTHLSFSQCNNAVQIGKNQACTMQDVLIDSCNQGITISGSVSDSLSTDQSAGSLVLLDFIIANTPTGIVASLADNSTSLLLQNGNFQNVSTAILDNKKGDIPLAAGDIVEIDSWAFGLLVTSSSIFVNGQDIPLGNRSASLTKRNAYHKPNLFTRHRPTYADIGRSQVINVKAWGAAGDGSTDDGPILNIIFSHAANMSAIVFIPFGVYVIEDTLEIPLGSRIIGQAWSQIMASGSNFQDEQKPRVAVRVGQPGDVGIVEIQSLMFTVRGPTAGAVLVEWNVHESNQGSAAMWDTHFRVGGAVGTDLQVASCPATPANSGTNKNCQAASLLLHLTPQSSAYLENVWAWTADHDMDNQAQITVHTGRGILIESQGPTWLYATASEHQAMYQYQISQAKDLYMSMIQAESPYFQPLPLAPSPFTAGLFANDPTFTDCGVSWALRIIDSTSICATGAALYSWYSNYSQTCLNTNTKDYQQRGVEIQQSVNVTLFNLMTKGISEMVSPTNENATLAANNIKGVISTILAWVRDDGEIIGAGKFPGFQLYNLVDLDNLGLTQTCKSALSQTIRCAPYLQLFASPGVGRWNGDPTFTNVLCDPGCGISLQGWFNNVASNCANQKLGSADPTLLGGYLWQRYNETCLMDPLSGRYCMDVITSSPAASSLQALPHADVCSWCRTHLMMMMQASPYSVYDSRYQDDLEYMVQECGLDTSTEIPPSLINSTASSTPSSSTPLCLSQQNYTVQENDTCDSIAQRYSVASAAILTTNPTLVDNCSNLTVGTILCLPLSCTPLYTLQSGEGCLSIQREHWLAPSNIQQYNPWIGPYCNNLLESTEVLGHVLCLGPQGGKFTPNFTNIARVGAEKGSEWRTGYSHYVTSRPFNAAEGTTEYCGVWYTVVADDTCATICMRHLTPASLFLAVNPSLSRTECDASLVVGTSYCIHPSYYWDTPDFWVERN